MTATTGETNQHQHLSLEEPPKIDADPGNMRLFVRGKPHQIAQIKQIVEEIDKADGGTLATKDSGNTVRLLPRGDWNPTEVLGTAARFWKSGNPVLTFPAVSAKQTAPNERVVSESSDVPVPPARDPSDFRAAQLLTSRQRTDKPPILCQVVSRGAHAAMRRRSGTRSVPPVASGYHR